MALGTILLVLIPILVVILLAVIASLPIYFALRLLGEPRSILRAILANFAAAVVYIITLPISFLGTIGAILSFIALLFSYKLVLRLGWVQSFLVWLLSIVLVALFWFIVALIPGLSLAMLGL